MNALSLALMSACLTLDETCPDGLRDAVESLHDAAATKLLAPRVARAAVDVIALHVDDCVFQFVCDGMGAGAYDEVSAAIGKFRWDFPRDDVADVTFNLKNLVGQLDHAVVRFNGKTCITGSDMRVLRDALRKLETV